MFNIIIYLYLYFKIIYMYSRIFILFILINLFLTSLKINAQQFYNSNGNYIGEVSYTNTINMKCGNCGAIYDKIGNKIGEASPIGGYREFTNNNGKTIGSWSLYDRQVYNQNRSLLGYEKNDKIFNSQNKQIGFVKLKDQEWIFYSLTGRKLMSAKVRTQHDMDVSLAYFLIFIYN